MLTKPISSVALAIFWFCILFQISRMAEELQGIRLHNRCILKSFSYHFLKLARIKFNDVLFY